MSGCNGKFVIECRNLAVGYKGKAVLSNINMGFEEGQFVALLGPNGAGKTTLLRTISNLLPAVSGSVQVMGKQLADTRASELARIMAVVLTSKVSPPLFSVFEFVSLGRYPHTGYLGRLSAKDCRIVQESLEAVNALDLIDRPFDNISDGERQKVLVARALAQEPQLLVLDEPTIHLDLKHRMEVMAILRDLCRAKGITVVASLHDVDVAAKVADKVVLVKKGEIADWGTTEKLLTGEVVSDLYQFEGVEFNRHLGSMELQGSNSCGKAFVVAGMGSGATLYRLLAKRGYAISTGIVHTNDLDFFVARSLGAECSSQQPMEGTDSDAMTVAMRYLEECDFVVDSGFDIGTLNQANLKLLQAAAAKGKRVFTLRMGDLGKLLVQNGNCICCQDEEHLLEALDGYCSNRQTTEQS